jgi:DNA-binding response OmpR family regulator
MRILLVEDDTMIGDSVRSALKHEGFAVDWVRDGRAAQATLATERFDLVLLDLGLPQVSGLDVLRVLRTQKDATPVIIVTARDDLASRVAGLDAGADDYLVKPFEL